MKKLLSSLTFLACLHPLSNLLAGEGHPVEKYNVVWTTPSEDYNGTMPIGNGDVAANVWVEPNGDLIFYVARGDAWSGGTGDGPELLKLGRVRVTLDPPLYKEGAEFRQELDLASGSITVEASMENQKRSIRFWIDANRPVVHVEIDSTVPCNASVALESWRAEGKNLLGGAQKDVIVPSNGETIRWYQRNVHSSYNDTLKVQHLEHLLGAFPDPLMNLTFGGLIVGDGMKAKDDQTLVTEKPMQRIHARIHAMTEQTETAEEWLANIELQRQEMESVSVEEAWPAHVAWWEAFWDRSYIHVSGTPDADRVAQAYQLQRWIQAGAGRGAYPIKFNGSLFTVDGLDARWAKPEGVYSGPDYRRWGGGYWWQNTRLVYWPMLYSGDYDQMLPLFKLYKDMLPLLRERTKHYYGHDGVFFSETSLLWGLNRNQDFGLNNPSFNNYCPYTRYEWQSGLELSAIMLDYYAHTGDDQFIKDTLLPIADEVLIFYDQHYKRNNRGKNGKLSIFPAQALETWHTAADPMPEVAGLHVVLDRLLALPKNLCSQEQQTRWERFKKEIPDIPTKQEGEIKWLEPARVYADKRNFENPELYAVFPYHVYGVGKADMEVAVETFKRRLFKGTGGWKQDAIQTAMLGMTDQAKEYVVESTTLENWKGKKDHPQCRFPAFWGPNADWIPDQDHASVFITALQRMLMLTDGKDIHLLPAWPDEWNVSFKLHAPYQTTVEGRVENGNVVDLKLTPGTRATDVINRKDSL